MASLSEVLEAIDFFSGRRAALVAAVLLASSRAVEGRTRFIKYVFLLQEEALRKGLLREPGETFEFKPFPLGPFSEDLASTIEFLRELGLIEVDVRIVTIDTPVGPVESERYDYRVTERGRNVLEKVLGWLGQRADKILEIAVRIRSEWDRRPVGELVDYVHRKYPQYMLKRGRF